LFSVRHHGLLELTLEVLDGAVASLVKLGAEGQHVPQVFVLSFLPVFSRSLLASQLCCCPTSLHPPLPAPETPHFVAVCHG